MKPYVLKTKYACGVDLHSRQMYICIMDRDGNVLVYTNIKGNNPAISIGTVFDLLRFCMEMAGEYRRSPV